MAFTIGEMIWKITGDDSGLDKTLKSTDKNVKKIAKGVDSLGKLFKSALFIKGAKILFNFGKSLINAASDAQETAQKFGVVFQSVIGKANALATELQTSYGLARTESKDLLAATGDLLTGFGIAEGVALEMSGTVVKLGADLASFSNYAGGAQGASKALTAALLGETEQAKSLGLALGETQLRQYAEGQGIVFKSLDLNEKMHLRLKLALSQSTKAQGDFTRSAGSYVNVQKKIAAINKNFAEDLGKEILPDLSLLGRAYIELSKDGGVFISSVKAVIKIVASLAKGIAALFVFVEQASTSGKLAGAEAAYEKALQRRAKNLQNAKKELNLYGKSAFELTKELEKVANAELKSFATEDVNKQKRAQEYLAAIKAQDAVLKETTSDQKKLADASIRLSKLQTELGYEASKVTADGSKSATEALAKEAAAREKVTKKTKKGLQDTRTELEKTIDTLETYSAAFNVAFDGITSILNAVNALQQAQTASRIEGLDAQLQAELEAAGLAEDSAVEKAEMEVARADREGSDEEKRLARNALKKAQIEEKFAKKKAEVEYEGALASWELQKAIAAIQLVQAPLNAYVSSLATPIIGPYIAPINAAIAAGVAGLQYASVLESRPNKPSFQFGGIVPGSSFSGDNVEAKLNSDEMVLTKQQQAELFNQANGGGGSRDLAPVVIDSASMMDILFQASQNGDLFIDNRAVVSR